MKNLYQAIFFSTVCIFYAPTLEAEPQTVEQLQAESSKQQELLLDLSRQKADQQADATQSKGDEDLRFQESRITESVILAQLQDQIAKQQALVEALRYKVRQQDSINIASDAFDRDRAELRAQEERLQNLRYQYQAAIVQTELKRKQATEQGFENILDRKFASENIAQQERDATEAYEKIQSDLKAIQDLETQKRALENTDQFQIR